MTYHQIFFFVDAATITLMVVLMGRFAWATRRSANAWLVVAMGAASIAYVLSCRQDYAALLPAAYSFDFGSLHPLLNLLRNAGPGLLALLCHRIFRPGQPFPVWLVSLILLQLGLEEPLEWLIGPAWAQAHPRPAALLYEVAPAVFQLAFMGIALYWLLAERSADLVEPRRQARTALLIYFAVQVVFTAGLERVGIFLGLVPIPAMYPIHALAVTAQMLVTLGICVVLMPAGIAGFVDPLALAQPAPEAPDTSTAEVDALRIRKALEEDHVYRQAGLTVAGLAAELGLPEYRLRRLIHDHLGYRNFNALLHEYRIAEVCAALADPARNGTPVLTLALSAGYQSLTPFNRAFKAGKGLTPTEYRHQSQRRMLPES